MTEKNNIGLVLSGGGARGLAHVGALKVLEELGLSVEFVAGTSAGALVGALYAGGHSANDILAFFKKAKLFTWHNLTRKKPGLVNMENFIPLFKEYLPDDDFDALHRKLFVTATDLLKPEGKIFDKGQVIRPVLASAAVPGVFSPIEIDGGLFVDGGVFNNFPIEPIQQCCPKIIGINVSPLLPMEKTEFKSSLSVLQRSYRIGVTNACLPKFNRCDVFLSPPELRKITTLGTNHLQNAFDIGYKAASEKAEVIRQLFEQELSS
ncbi:MAG: patatin-like phospholipase family protein [Saprospiraceae bacterium]